MVTQLAALSPMMPAVHVAFSTAVGVTLAGMHATGASLPESLVPAVALPHCHRR